MLALIDQSRQVLTTRAKTYVYLLLQINRDEFAE